MMNVIKRTKEEMVKLLSANKYLNLHEIENISYCETQEFFSYGNNFIIQQTGDDNSNSMLIINDEHEFPFVYEAFKTINTTIHAKQLLSINCKVLKDTDKQILIRDNYSFKGEYNSFVSLSKDNNIKESTNVIEMNKTHTEYANNTLFPPKVNRPTFTKLYEIFVLKGQGRIFAYIEDTKIKGYLSCLKFVDNIWDLDYIYVDENNRNIGIAKALSIKYANTIINEGCVPYWSNAVSEASSNTALSAGFTLCCRHYYYEK